MDASGDFYTCVRNVSVMIELFCGRLTDLEQILRDDDTNGLSLVVDLMQI